MNEQRKKNGTSAAAGWIALGLGLIGCFIWGFTGGLLSFGIPDLATIVSLILALPLLIASFVLSIVSMCKGQAFSGVALMVATFTLPALTSLVGMLAST